MVKPSWFWLAVAAILGGLNIACPVHAQSSAQTFPAGLTIYPSIQQFNIQADQPQAAFKLSVANNNSYTQVVHISGIDFTSIDEFGGIGFRGFGSLAAAEKYGLANWMTFNQTDVSIPAGGTETVIVSVQNRPDFGPGAHYGAVLVTKQDSAASVGAGKVPLKQIISSLVFVNKLGGERYGLLLDSVRSSKNFFATLKTVVRFQNNGNVTIVPRGYIELVNPLGHVAARGSINDDSGLLLPDTHRQYQVQLYKTGSFALPGKYKLITHYRYDGKDVFLTEVQSLFTIGQLTLSAIILVIAVVCIFIIGWLYGWKGRAQKT